MALGEALAAAGVSTAASAANSGINLLFNKAYQKQQKQLLENQYDTFIDKAKSAGVTPAGIAQGLVGSGVSSTPQVSAPNNTPDIGANAANLYNSLNEGMLKESQREYNKMLMYWEPKKFFADIKQSFSAAFKNMKEGRYFGQLKSYYKELEGDIVQKRPWQILGLKAGLVKSLAEFDNILQNTNTSRALQGVYEQDVKTGRSQEALNYQGVKTGQAQESYYNAAAENQWSESFNRNLEAFKLQFENDLRANGWNPSQKPWDNVMTNLFRNPFMFKEFANNAINALDLLDNRLKESLGDHYKRNALVGYSMYRQLQGRPSRQLMRNQRYNNNLRTIISIIPGTSPGSTGNLSTQGQYWWEKD